ncbi:MAG: DMT family transporter, partial [Candidatus Nanopelagicaceae bacterium]
MLSKLRGEIYLLSGALLFSFNGIISKIVLVDGLSAWRLTQIRTGGAFVILFAIYFTFRRSELKTNKKELPWLIAFGVVGVALVQAFYFVAIERLYVGVALLIEFTAPIWILLFLRFVLKKHVPNSLWYAIL